MPPIKDVERIKHPNFGRVILNEVQNLCETGEILRSASSAQNDVGTIIFFRVPNLLKELGAKATNFLEKIIPRLHS